MGLERSKPSWAIRMLHKTLNTRHVCISMLSLYVYIPPNNFVSLSQSKP